MATFSLEAEKSLIISILKERLSPIAIVLFGSGAKNRLGPESDIDVAFLADRSLDELALFRLSQELSLSLNRDVDLIDLSTASTVFQAQILSTGQVIFCRNSERLLAFHALTLKKYARLNEERQCIFDAERERMRAHDS
ncbi:nucleotidyltransferase domain-containing protein [Heliobacterium undosum]|uniref:Nucleotidyltransferase domain-containing protein n=1 Tax=Heliomicrobium undosum TaxID=121734 RepID=A0A845L4L3_9FIRM|nr:nucleotidyltransferase domain-containing protein [Heliomicrobium undosum]MZP29784.1 nucleotidyltransferase domain-containing protein [Heliomicrobium undosum]